jgi:hypothetical protein
MSWVDLPGFWFHNTVTDTSTDASIRIEIIPASPEACLWGIAPGDILRLLPLP